MKRRLLILLLLVTVFQGFSQTRGISYQAVILSPNAQEIPGVNAQGNILANSAVSIQFTIVNASGTEEYQEQHSIRTDRYGMINLLIGTGTPTSSTDFTDIKWVGTTKKLKVGIDFKGGTNFSPLSEQNLSYMPQPPTEEVTIEITNNAAAIATEKARAIQAEQESATDISALKTEQTTQNAAIAVNTAKVGITPAQASTISNTTGINTGDQDISGIAINAGAITTLQGEQTMQNTTIALNTAKTGITAQQASDITTNNAKTGITTAQATAISDNSLKTGITSGQADAIVANTLKTGITTAQATAISNNSGAITTLQGEQTTQNTAIALNTAKTGITTQQASDITTNNAKVGITTQQASDITTNNAKVGITSGQADAIVANTAKVSYPGDQDISGIAINSGAITTLQGEQTTQNTAIALNTAKISYPGDQDLTGLEPKITTKNTAFNKDFGTTAGTVLEGNTLTLPTGGTEGQILKIVGGIPVWTDASRIGGSVWIDLNGDGIRNAEEPGIFNVFVKLTYPDESIDFQITDGNGNYLFTKLATGTYSVELTNIGVPVGYDATTPTTFVETLEVAENYLDANFGFKDPATSTIGGAKWIDLNGDSLKNAGELDIIEGVVVNLTNSEDIILTQTTTDANGRYLFTNLTAGVYRVVVTYDGVPKGYRLTTANNPFSVTVQASINKEGINFGFKDPATSSIGGYVWNDLDGDGIPDQNEPDISNVVVKLTYPDESIDIQITDANGNYLFANLPAGTYSVEVTNIGVPTGYVATTSTTFVVILGAAASYLKGYAGFWVQ